MKKRLLALFPVAVFSCFLTCIVDERNSTMICRVSNIDDVKKFFPTTVSEIEERAEYAKRAILAQVNAIISAENKSWLTVADALDRLSDLYYPVSSSIEVLLYVHPDPQIRQAAQKACIDIRQFLVEHIELNKKLFDTFKEYAEQVAPREDLSETQRYFISETLKSFERSGLNLPDDEILEVQKLMNELTDLSQQFEVNISVDNRTFKVSGDELKGLSENFIKNLKRDGDLFEVGVDNPTYTAVMEDCSVASTREKMFKAYQNRAYPQNKQVLTDILNKRDKLAKKLGFKSFAHLCLDKLMAKKPEVAYDFLNTLFDKALVKAKKELAEWTKELPSSVEKTSGGKFKPWDMTYLQAEYKKSHLVSENEIRKYFPMENTVKQLLAVYEKFFDLKFSVDDASGMWHEDVQVIEVSKNNKLIGFILLDLYPRPNKYTHACHASMVRAVKRSGVECPALSIVIANFPKSTEDEPSLLKYWDVRTFFHEFGHAIHALLGRTEQYAFAGTSVKRDFVEMPSQMLENWLQDKEILKMISSHYQTGELLPDELISKIIQMIKFNTGYFITRQIGFALLSLDYYAEGSEKDLDGIAKQIANKTAPDVERDPGSHFWASFGHLTGYGAGYYGYLWSDVYSKDLFEHIAQEGLLNPEAGRRYSEAILAPGGSKDPSDMLYGYLNRKPSQDAFLKAMGLTD